MGNIKITRKLLDSYKKLKKEIPVLEMELDLMEQGDSGFGFSTILDYREGTEKVENTVYF